LIPIEKGKQGSHGQFSILDKSVGSGFDHIALPFLHFFGGAVIMTRQTAEPEVLQDILELGRRLESSMK